MNVRNDDFNFHQQLIFISEKEDDDEEGRITILYNKTISEIVLIRYLDKRNISLSIAEKCCSEIIYEMYRKNYVELGFRNDSGAYELRNEFFKGSNSPKDVTTIKNKGKKVAVFEGFFDSLSLISCLEIKN